MIESHSVKGRQLEHARALSSTFGQGKRVTFFSNYAEVDAAEKVTILPGTSFLHINGVCLSTCLSVCLLPMIFFNWYLNIDKGMTNLIVLLDLAKAFDTVSHNILLKKLELCGLNGVTLDWFSSYLSDRQQQCVVEGCVSRRVTLLTGTTFLYKNGAID